MTDIFNLLDENHTTARVVFSTETGTYLAHSKKYSYKVPRAWNLEKGELLVVSARGFFHVVKVAVVDLNPDMVGLSRLSYAIQKVDLTEHDAAGEREEKFRDALVQVERQKQKDELILTLEEQAKSPTPAGDMLREALGLLRVVPSIEHVPHEPVVNAPEDTEQVYRVVKSVCAGGSTPSLVDLMQYASLAVFSEEAVRVARMRVLDYHQVALIADSMEMPTVNKIASTLGWPAATARPFYTEWFEDNQGVRV